jgi:hypothetical protein
MCRRDESAGWACDGGPQIGGKPEGSGGSVEGNAGRPLGSGRGNGSVGTLPEGNGFGSEVGFGVGELGAGAGGRVGEGRSVHGCVTGGFVWAGGAELSG